MVACMDEKYLFPFMVSYLLRKTDDTVKCNLAQKRNAVIGFLLSVLSENNFEIILMLGVLMTLFQIRSTFMNVYYDFFEDAIMSRLPQIVIFDVLVPIIYWHDIRVIKSSWAWVMVAIPGTSSFMYTHISILSGSGLNFFCMWTFRAKERKVFLLFHTDHVF